MHKPMQITTAVQLFSIGVCGRQWGILCILHVDDGTPSSNQWASLIWASLASLPSSLRALCLSAGRMGWSSGYTLQLAKAHRTCPNTVGLRITLSGDGEYYIKHKTPSVSTDWGIHIWRDDIEGADWEPGVLSGLGQPAHNRVKHTLFRFFLSRRLCLG